MSKTIPHDESALTARLDMLDAKGRASWSAEEAAEYVSAHEALGAIARRRSTRVTTPNPIGGAHHVVPRGHAAVNDYCNLHGVQSSQLSTGGFKSFGELLSVFGSGRHDGRIHELASAASKLAGSGGILVPDAYVAQMLHPAHEGEVVLPRARRFSMQNFGTLKVSALDNLSNASGELYGGFSAEWVAEGESFTEQTPETTGVTLTRRKLGLFTASSRELVDDSAYEQMLIPALQSALADFRDSSFLVGDGVGKPRGVLYDSALIEVAKESGQAAATILIENIDKMFARLHPRMVSGAVWVANPSCVPQLLGLVRTAGTGGVPVPALNESNGAFFLLGLPVVLSSKVPTLGTKGDLMLANLGQYAVGESPGIVLDRSEHYRFQSDQIVWKCVWRGDGQGLWRAPFTPRNGSTLSWCVALATRS